MRTGGLNRILAIAEKEFIHIRRDKRIIASVLIMPVAQLLLFAYAISFDVKNVPTVILDYDKTPASRAYLESYGSTEFFDIRGQVDDLDEIDEAFERGNASVAVIVPPGFARSIAADKKAQVAVLVDGGEPNSAQLGQAFAQALNQFGDRQVLVEWAERTGLDTTRFGQLEPRLRTWFNPERRSADFLIPGLMVVIVMIVTMQQTAVTLVRERDQGTQEQILVSPVRHAELMVGKLLPWTIIGFVDMAAITLLAVLVFGVPLRGDVLLLALASVVFVFCSLAMGLIVSALAPSPESANISALLIAFLPGFMLSGFAFPLETIPGFLQFVSYLFPGRYMVVITRGVFLKGASFPELWPPFVALTVYAIVALSAASILYGRRER